MSVASSELLKQITIDLQLAKDELGEARKEWQQSIGQMNHSNQRIARAQIAVSRVYSLLLAETVAAATMAPISG